MSPRLMPSVAPRHTSAVLDVRDRTHPNLCFRGLNFTHSTPREVWSPQVTVKDVIFVIYVGRGLNLLLVQWIVPYKPKTHVLLPFQVFTDAFQFPNFQINIIYTYLLFLYCIPIKTKIACELYWSSITYVLSIFLSSDKGAEKFSGENISS